MNKKVVLACLVGIMAIALAGCGVKNNVGQQQANTEPIKIGWIGPLTTDVAIYGDPMSKVVKMAADEINQNGGINGRPLQIIFEDGKCNGKDAVSAAQKLINIDKVKVILGGYCSGETLPIIPLAEQNNVYLFSAGASSPALSGISKMFARDYPSDASQGITLANISYNDMKWRKVAFIQEQTDYAKGIYGSFEKQFISLGGQITKEETPSDRTDFRTMIKKLQAVKPDAVFIDTQAAPAAERIVKQMAELNWHPKLMISETVMGDTATIERNKQLFEGTLGAEFGIDPNNQKFQHALKLYSDTYGQTMPYQSFSQTQYDAVYLLKDAIAAVGYDGVKISDWIRNVKDWQGASGVINFVNGDRTAGPTPKIVKNGKVEIFQK